MAEFFDVVIAGGGPAGSTAGTLLAQHGWNVAIFEKERFPRFKIGESLLPGSIHTFERMGVKEKIDKADVIVLKIRDFLVYPGVRGSVLSSEGIFQACACSEFCTGGKRKTVTGGPVAIVALSCPGVSAKTIRDDWTPNELSTKSASL